TRSCSIAGCTVMARAVAVGVVSVVGGMVSNLGIAGGSVTGCLVGGDAGGGTVSISGGSVTGTHVGVEGGGGTVNISGGSGTTVVGGDLGVGVSGGTVSISGGSVAGNNGGVNVFGGTATISGCTALTNPQPNGSGGTIYSLTGTLLDGTAINTAAEVSPPGRIVLDEHC